MSKYCLIVAGEPSGDLLGSPVVKTLCDQGMMVWGSGGTLMAQAGLKVLVPFADLAVAGFGDVLCRIFTLRRHLKTLQKALTDPQCCALFCIDYPGFNMPLMQLAKSLVKPVFWVAPPQIWAWNARRARHFINVPVAVLFPFEQQSYDQAGAQVTLVTHPLVQKHRISQYKSTSGDSQSPVAVFPGSRWPQLRRNLSWIRTLSHLVQQRQGVLWIVVAQSDHINRLQKIFKHPRILIKSRQELTDIRWAICTPGTVTLDLVLGGVPCAVVSRIDWLTWIMGRTLLKTPWLALPNIILRQQFISEHYTCWPFNPAIQDLQQKIQVMENTDPNAWNASRQTLLANLQGESLDHWTIGCLQSIGLECRNPVTQ